MKIIRHLFLILFFFYQNLFSTEINNEEFNLKLDKNWIVVETKELGEFKSILALNSSSEYSAKYNYAIKRKDSENILDGPFILIKIERIFKDINKTDSNDFEETIQKELSGLDKRIDSIMSTKGAKYDEISGYYKSIEFIQLEAQKYKILKIQKKSIFGKVSLSFYSIEDSFSDHEDSFLKIARSLKFKEKYDLDTRMNEIVKKVSIETEQRNFVHWLFWTVVTTVTGFLLKQLFSKKEEPKEVQVSSDSSSTLEKKSQFDSLTEDNQVSIRTELKKEFAHKNEKVRINKELKNLLISVNERLSTIEYGFVMTFIVIGILISVGLHMGYVDQYLKLDLKEFHVWYVYILIPTALIYFAFIFCIPFKKLSYSNRIEDILTTARRQRISKYKLIALMHNKSEYEYISTCLKKDLDIRL